MRKLSRGIFERDGVLYVRFANEKGEIVRESTGQSSPKVAQDILSKRRTEVAQKTYFPSRRFETVRFEDLLSKWWEEHGQHTRSCFKYLRRRIEGYFSGMKAHDVKLGTIMAFLNELKNHGYSAAYSNSHRTMLNSIFNFAIKTGDYDKNPVSLVRQRREPERTRLLGLDEWQRLLDACRKDPELPCFVILASVTTARKSEILSRHWSEVHLHNEFPYMEIPVTKNDDPKIVPLPAVAIEELKKLPSYGKSEYVFPAKPTHRYDDPSKFKRPHRWDMRKPFLATCKRAGIENLHIHDLRHLGPSILLAQGVPDNVVAKITGHRSRALKRYQHLSQSFRKQTVDLIAQVLMKRAGGTDTRTDTPAGVEPGTALDRRLKSKKSKGLDGRPVGTRTPDLYRVKVAL